MSDLSDALKKAGLVSDKEIRQKKHGDRVKRKKLGKDGLEAERRQREEAHEAEQERKREEDREREKQVRADKASAGGQSRLVSLLKDADLSTREAGPKRFFFQLPDGRITFLDVAPGLVRRLAQGDTAILDSRELLPRDFAIVTGKVATEVERMEPGRILLWNARR